MPRLPEFLVVGAQKCGTTTLHADLQSHPRLALSEKESSGLLGVEADARGAVRRYAAQFPDLPGTKAGEVSTQYAMLPFRNLASVAASVIGSAKIIYIARNPIQRTISHHHHLMAQRRLSEPLDVAVRTHPELVDFSRYATQIEPWIEAFDRENVLILKFEDYVRQRQRGANGIFEWLGVGSWELPQPTRVHNAADEKRVATGLWRRVSHSSSYRRYLRPFTSAVVRRRLTEVLLNSPPSRPAPPSPSTTEYLREQLDPEVWRLGEITGAGPWWDLRQVPEGGVGDGPHD